MKYSQHTLSLGKLQLKLTWLGRSLTSNTTSSICTTAMQTIICDFVLYSCETFLKLNIS